MAITLCPPHREELKRKAEEVHKRCEEVADKWIEYGMLDPRFRCDFIMDCFAREMGRSSLGGARSPRVVDPILKIMMRRGR